jgi:membrane protein
MRMPGFANHAPSQVLKQAIENFLDDNMLAYAAALAYRILLALFPFIIFLLTLLGALGVPQFFDWLLQQAQTALPAVAFQLVEQVVGEIRERPRTGLLSVSIAFALWTASTGMRTLMTALNTAYDVAESRPVWWRFPLSLLYTLGLAVLLIAVSALMLLGPDAMRWLAGHLGLSREVAPLWFWLRWPVIVVLLLVTFAIVYKVAPNIDQPFRLVTPGSVIGVFAWIAASVGFSYYVANFGAYGATYGSLGGIIVLLLYFYISGAVLLFGAEINASIHPAHESPRDAGLALQ